MVKRPSNRVLYPEPLVRDQDGEWIHSVLAPVFADRSQPLADNHPVFAGMVIAYGECPGFKAGDGLWDIATIRREFIAWEPDLPDGADGEGWFLIFIGAVNDEHLSIWVRPQNAAEEGGKSPSSLMVVAGAGLIGGLIALLASFAQATPPAVSPPIKIGTTYPIAEKNAIDAIQQKLTAMQQSGELAELEKKAQARMTHNALNLPPVEGLTRTSKASVRYLEPSYSLPESVYDHEGRLIAPTGATVKPLEVTTIRHRMFFFDGRDPDQVKLAEKLAKEIGPDFMPILVAGEWAKLSEQLGQAVYFDQQGKMSRNFVLTHVPSLVSQEGKQLKIEEMLTQ